MTRSLEAVFKKPSLVERSEAGEGDFALAKSVGLDLIEVSNSGTSCICKIADYGKYTYDLSKKEKEIKRVHYYIIKAV